MNCISAGTVNPVHTIPAVNDEGEETIDLSVLSDWDDLAIEKKRYLVSFSKSKLKKKRAAINCGIDPYDITAWLKDDPAFARIFEDIIDLHTEAVEEMDYVASFSSKNNTSRGRFLDKRSKVYKEREREKQPQLPAANKTTNVLAILSSDDVTNKGLAGVAKVFNKMKQEGNVPEQIEEKK